MNRPGQAPGAPVPSLAEEGPAYISAHLRDALAQDPRTGELGLEVVVDGGEVFVRGQVTTDQRRQAVVEVVEELVPGFQVHSEVRVVDHGGAPASEVLP
ncbi:MAG: BON domain-containing protein [Acidimicrobiales bacterium]